MLKKLTTNKGGFTLTEVLVGVLVLATAIVSASNLLVSMQRSNEANMSSLQAYYYTVEGIEAFRNMRDTHFMHNVSFCGQDGVNLFGKDGSFLDGCKDTGYGEYYYAVHVNPGPSAFAAVSGNDLSASSPWRLIPVFDVRSEDARVAFNQDISTSVSTEFYRYCEVKPLEDFDGKAIEVICNTEWEENGRDRNVTLSTVLTDWYDK